MHVLELTATVALLAIYAIWRITVSHRARIRYITEMPPKNQLSRRVTSIRIQAPYSRDAASQTQFDDQNGPVGDIWTEFSGPTMAKTQSGDFDDPVFFAAAMDGAIRGATLFHAVASIDPSVLGAVEFSTAAHLHTLPTMDTYVHDHFFAAPVQSADGWFERLTGYVTEQKATAALRAMGHHVEVAPVANQPVWDLIVDGKHVQIKEGLSGVREFLAQHHGIDIYTSPEGAAAVKDPLVHGLQSINSDHIHQVTHQSIEGMNDISHPGFHFPWITIVFSCWRETKLLFDEKTSLDRAVKHLGMDAAGVGVGLWAGAKAGAMSGAIFGPHVAAAGAFFGAIFGAIGGKKVSRNLQHAPFRAAKASYDETVAKAQTTVQEAIDSSRTQLAALQKTYQEQFLEARNAILEKAKTETREISADFQGRLLKFYLGFPRLLSELIAQLDIEEQEILQAIPNRGVWGLLFPVESDHLRSAWKAWFRQTRKSIRKEQLKFENIEPQTLDTLHRAVQLFLKEYTFDLDAMDQETMAIARSLHKSRSSAKGVLSKAEDEIREMRTRLIERFTDQVAAIHKGIVDTIQRWNKEIMDCKTVVEREGKPLGIEF